VKSKAEQHAANCLRLAASVQDQQAHAMLMHMAEAWIRLAASQEAAGLAPWKVTEPSDSQGL
jgi:hypothetical protein